MAKKKVKASPKDSGESKVFAFLGVFLTIIGFIIVLLAKKDDKYAMYYAKQGLALFICWVVLFVIAWIPILGWIIGFIGYIILLILWIMGLVYSLSGEMKPVPLVGTIADKFNI